MFEIHCELNGPPDANTTFIEMSLRAPRLVGSRRPPAYTPPATDTIVAYATC